MKNLQITTTAGIGGLVASVTKFFSLFGDYKISEFSDAIYSMTIGDVGIALLGVGISLYGIFHDENRGE